MSAEATRPCIGFVSPPGWIDPSPAEFPTVCAEPVRTQQVPLRALGFDWHLESVAQMEPELVTAAATLADMGCSVAAMTGTRFAWAGASGVDEARARCERVTTESRIATVTAGLAIVDALQALRARKVALACSFYSAAWRDLWAGFVSSAGFELTARTLVDQGLWREHGAEDRACWSPTEAEIADHVRRLVAEAGHAEAVAVTGAGARTLGLIRGLESEIGRPVIGADTALYWAAARAGGVPLKPGALGALTEV